MEISAILKNAPLSAQKARLVGDQIRGMPVEKALNLLKFSSKKAATIIKKMIQIAKTIVFKCEKIKFKIIN